MRVLVFLMALLPTMVSAAPPQQLLRSVEHGLREYRINTDVAKLTTAQAAALHLRLSSPEHNFIGSDFRTRQFILSVLRWNDATNPDLK